MGLTSLSLPSGEPACESLDGYQCEQQSLDEICQPAVVVSPCLSPTIWSTNICLPPSAPSWLLGPHLQSPGPSGLLPQGLTTSKAQELSGLLSGSLSSLLLVFRLAGCSDFYLPALGSHAFLEIGFQACRPASGFSPQRSHLGDPALRCGCGEWHLLLSAPFCPKAAKVQGWGSEVWREAQELAGGVGGCVQLERGPKTGLSCCHLGSLCCVALGRTLILRASPPQP